MKITCSKSNLVKGVSIVWRWGEMISPFCTNAQKNGKIGLKSCHFHALQLYLDKVK